MVNRNEHPITQEHRDWLRLYRTSRVGTVTFRQLLRRFGSAGAALDALPELSMRANAKSPITPYSKEKTDQEIEQLQSIGGQLIIAKDDVYPHLLKHSNDHPPVLSCLGNLSLLQKPSIAIVGSRNASLNGNKLTQTLAEEIGQKGYVITSGLARGIDRSAHLGGLKTGTIAVVAGGVDVIYPKDNTDIYNEIKENGLIIAENKIGLSPRSIDFPRRNRIVSGLSQGVVVIEAALRSGSLITARLAGEQGRDVFAVPGSPLDPRAKGTNALIRDGATLVESAEQIIEQLQNFKQDDLFAPPQNLEETEIIFESDCPPADDQETVSLPKDVPADLHNIILAELSNAPTPINDVIGKINQPTAECLSAILDLELGGQITRYPGNKVARLYE